VVRESALERADEEEEQKLIQNKGNKKKRGSHAITKSVVDSDTGTTVKRQKEKRVDDETVNRRTVFVGNLPVSCTIQVCEWVPSTKGMKRWGCFQLRSHTYL